MFRFLRHHEIDFKQWDHCIIQSPQNIIYALSWYLDISSPGWAALVNESEGNYLSVLPLTIKRKWTISYMAQPFLSQQLGFFSKKQDNAFIEEALDFIINKFVLIDYNFHSLNTEALRKGKHAQLFRERVTHCLHLGPSYQELLANYSSDRKQNIKRALKHLLQVQKSDDFHSLINMFRAMKGEELNMLKSEDYQKAANIYEVCKYKAKEILYFAVDKDGNKLAGGLFLLFQKRIIYIFSIASEEGRKKSAMNLILDEVIREYAGTDHVLDFEGGEIDGIGKFFKGFGAEVVTYLTLNHTKIPWLRKK